MTENLAKKFILATQELEEVAAISVGRAEKHSSVHVGKATKLTQETGSAA